MSDELYTCRLPTKSQYGSPAFYSQAISSFTDNFIGRSWAQAPDHKTVTILWVVVITIVDPFVSRFIQGFMLKDKHYIRYIVYKLCSMACCMPWKSIISPRLCLRAKLIQAYVYSRTFISRIGIK